MADSLEKGTEHEDEYMISEKELLVNRFDTLEVGRLHNIFIFPIRLKCETIISPPVLAGSFRFQKIWEHSTAEPLLQEL